MQIFRTFFKKEIFAEVLLPDKATTKVAIFCDGAPSAPRNRDMMGFFAKKGYAAFHIRYRGMWESKGLFLQKSLDQDLIDVIDALPKGFTDLWTKKRYAIAPKHIVLVGASFGGPAVILASRDPRVNKVIAISPVVDWRKDGKAERMKDWIPFMLEAYSMAYRASRARWNKLLNGMFYNPVAHAQEIDGSKIFILHAKDDDVVPFIPIRQFARKIKATLVARSVGGHLRTSLITQPILWKKISKFLKASSRSMTTRSQVSS